MSAPFRAKRLIDLINCEDNVPHDFDYSVFYKLLLPEDTRPHGFLDPDIVAKLPWTSDFNIDHDTMTIQLSPASGIISVTTINAAFQAVVDGAVDLGTSVFSRLTSHSEMYRVLGAKSYNLGGSSTSTGTLIQLERFAAPYFGISSRGAHMTAYVRDATDGSLKIWVARRAAHLNTFPGMLDTTVAGGVKAADSPRACILAEADEEASLPRDYVEKKMVATGALTYVYRTDDGVTPTVIYVYDLELEKDREPRPNDDEVEGFYLLGVEEIVQRMMDWEFKPNCCLVMLDFFLRHGVLTEENEGDYLELLTRLRRTLPVPVTAQTWL